MAAVSPLVPVVLVDERLSPLASSVRPPTLATDVGATRSLTSLSGDPPRDTKHVRLALSAQLGCAVADVRVLSLRHRHRRCRRRPAPPLDPGVAGLILMASGCTGGSSWPRSIHGGLISKEERSNTVGGAEPDGVQECGVGFAARVPDPVQPEPENHFKI